MARRILIALGVLAVVAGGLLFWAWHSLDVLVKVAIERFGPEIAGVSVTVREVRLSTADGKGSIQGLEIGNPKGFNAARAARFGEIRVVVDPSTLREDLVVIREIAIESPEIAYEKGSNTTNLDVIQRNIEGHVSRASGEPRATPGGKRESGRRYAIEKLTIRSARVTMTTPALRGQGLSFTLPDIHLRDVGRRPRGVTAGEAAGVVASAIVTRIAQRVLTSIDLLRKGGTEGAVDALRRILK